MGVRWVDGLAGALARRTSRRGFLARTAVIGAAVAADPVNYVLRPASAYSSVCGEGSSCSSGWTAFCVTVNNGVNQCPPGSFAAGWWKADNASVCGGHARYYVDCNASCVDGRRGHYTCSCRCAPTTTCDKRRTCCNQFRYGQCHQEISCYGPVVCRVVSCVPPWTWAHCSRSSATDNRTLTHSAPALPHSYDAVERRYVALHGHASPLGASVGGRQSVAGGLLQRYQHGLLAWSPSTPASMLLTCAVGYLHAGGPGGFLRFPTRDERLTADGQAHLAHLQGGYVYAGGASVAHAPNGPWLSRWVALADDMAVVGRPASHVVAGVDHTGRVGLFWHGCLSWSPETGVHLVSGDCFTRYVEVGREGSPLGYPTADTAPTPVGDGSWTAFAGGAVVSSSGGTWDVTGAVFAYWRNAGLFSSGLGLPTSAVVAATTANALVGHFVHGDVYTSPQTGTFAVLEPLRTAYLGNGGDGGQLGLPVADATTDGTRTTQQFQGGSISNDSATGTTSVTYAQPPATSPSPAPTS